MRACHILAAALLFSSTGCFLFASSGTPAPLEVTVRASKRLNPDEHGQPLVTAVRVYQLKSSSRIEAADYDDVYRRDKAVLGEDLVQVDELVLSPGQEQTKTIPRDKATRFVAVVAVVRRPAGTSWRTIAELPSGQTDLVFAIQDYRIERK